jgi:hypothetical protein
MIGVTLLGLRVHYEIGKFEEDPQFHLTKVILLQGRLENSISNKLIPFQAGPLASTLISSDQIRPTLYFLRIKH